MDHVNNHAYRWLRFADNSLVIEETTTVLLGARRATDSTHFAIFIYLYILDFILYVYIIFYVHI